ncbi:MAG TPA: hypothetical protein ACFYD4_08380 [Candidatus Wunengus sp. YC61]|uniref:hypothetical protein n=1 Tax=Candidatus Wunengus sp. YC61 TaxID=3367698 RepID=UPI004026649E
MKPLCERLQAGADRRRQDRKQRDISCWLIGVLCGVILTETVQAVIFMGTWIF